MEQSLLDILACPLCKGKLVYQPAQHALLCRFDRLAYPIRQGIQVMLVDEARRISSEEDF